MKYLALGDSYTIGEQVNLKENFPHQLVKVLSEEYDKSIHDPTIIATTGWTTGELLKGIKDASLKDRFDFTTLLIGVNNQYRGYSLEEYKQEFALLLNKAILYTGGRKNRVFVLSIPDWGVTPFAAEKDSSLISKEINNFNAVNKAITTSYMCKYIDITERTRVSGKEVKYLTPDKLHYSAEEYREWVNLLAPVVAASL
jgi:lysophospholipase L1-like esterase